MNTCDKEGCINFASKSYGFNDYCLVHFEELDKQPEKPSALDVQVGGSHYKDMPIQPITYIVENKLDWYQGNIVKYASRHHFKNGAEDLKKVIHYAQMALEKQYKEK